MKCIGLIYTNDFYEKGGLGCELLCSGSSPCYPGCNNHGKMWAGGLYVDQIDGPTIWGQLTERHNISETNLEPYALPHCESLPQFHYIGEESAKCDTLDQVEFLTSGQIRLKLDEVRLLNFTDYCLASVTPSIKKGR